jgi:hypothetical protein
MAKLLGREGATADEYRAVIGPLSWKGLERRRRVGRCCPFW